MSTSTSTSANPVPAPPCVLAPSDDAWFNSEVRPHESDLRGYLHTHFPALGEVDDIVQESYLRLLKARAAGPIHCVRGYLFGIARNTAYKNFRSLSLHRRVFVNDEANPDIVSGTSDVAAAVNLAQEMALATEAIDTLPPRCREIVILRVLHHQDHREIAQKLSLSEETVRVQVARGMKRLAQYLRERGVKRP